MGKDIVSNMIYRTTHIDVSCSRKLDDDIQNVPAKSTTVHQLLAQDKL